MKTAMIIGGSGQDGSYLIELLAKRGYRSIVATTRGPLRALSNFHKQLPCQWITCDFTSPKVADNVLTQIEPEEIYFLSGLSSVAESYGSPSESIASNTHGLLNVLELLRRKFPETRLFYAGSGEMYGGTSIEGATESDLFNPRSPYACSKVIAHTQIEMYREIYGVFCCTGFMFNHESPRRPKNFVTQKIVMGVHNINKGKQEKLLLGNTSIIRDWGWAPDYVTAFPLMLSADAPVDYIIATGQPTSLLAFVSLCFEFLSLDSSDYLEEDPSLHRRFDAAVSIGDPKKIFEELGWSSSASIHDVVKGLMCNE